MDKGTYVLLLKTDACTIQVGALGMLSFRKGWYAYVGSALGPGGFVRIARHIRVNHEKKKKPRWHIDYLLLSPTTHLSTVFCIHTDQRLECTVSHLMDGEVIPGFGSSDCDCKGHLYYYISDPSERLNHIICSHFAIEADNTHIQMKQIGDLQASTHISLYW